MSVLLDVNLLIALLDPQHDQHALAHRWFPSVAGDWATCPLTQNGLVRIITNARYPNAVTTATAWRLLGELCGQPGHSFWPDTTSLLDERIYRRSLVSSSSQITATYLLGLAAAKAGRLATLDRRLTPTAVVGGDRALLLVH